MLAVCNMRTLRFYTCYNFYKVNLSLVCSFSRLSSKANMQSWLIQNFRCLWPQRRRLLPRRFYSTRISSLINSNEDIISNFVKNLMESYRTHGDLQKSLCASLSSKKIQDVKYLLSSRSVLCDELISLEELKSGNFIVFFFIKKKVKTNAVILVLSYNKLPHNKSYEFPFSSLHFCVLKNLGTLEKVRSNHNIT